MIINIRFLLIVFLLTVGLLSFESQELQAKIKGKTKWFSFKQTKKDTMRVRWNGRHLEIQLKPWNGEGGYALANRVLNRKYKSLKTIHNQKGGKKLLRNHYITFPVKVLNGSIRSSAMRAIFPKDRIDQKGWRHIVSYSWETTTLIAGLFAKKSITATKLASHNKLSRNGNLLKIKDRILIPWKWISPELEMNKPSLIQPLVLKYDSSGRVFGEYRLKDGETIYSSVVIRFTGRILHDEVNNMAKDLLKLNGILNPRRIQQNQKIKIPIEWLSEEFVKLAQTSKVAVKQKVKNTKITKKPNPNYKMHIILDAGHGGKDPGAVAGSVKKGDRIYEDDVVYDISQRLKGLLKKEGFKVHPTLIDPNQRKPISRLNKRHDKDEYLNVSPHYTVKDSRTGVNMRIFLINHIYKKLLNKKVPKENIIFLSIHGDALHSSVRGAMVYYPDHRFRKTGFSINRKVYRDRKEFTKRINFASDENKLSEELSLSFGKSIITSFKKSRLTTYRGTAVRGYFFRRGMKTLPAVLRYCKVPTSVLVEVANLNNFKDRKNLHKSQVRQQMAQALINSIRNHYMQTRVILASR